MLCVQPLYLNAARYIRLTWHKYIFFVVYMCIILLAVLIVWAYRLTRKPRLLPQDKLSIADYAVLGFAVVTLLSTLFSPFKSETNVWIGLPERYDGAITQLLYITIFFIISRWYKPRERDFIFFGISAILIALIGIFQFYGMDFLKLWPNDMPEYKVENFYNIFFRSTLGNVNIVATYVCVAILLCGFLFIKKKSKWQPLWLAGSALNFWLMELADSDSGRVGVMVALVLSIPFIIENRKTIGRFLILGSTWIAVFVLQKLFYNVLILNTRTIVSLLPFIAAFVVLLAAGLLLALLEKPKHCEDRIRWKLGLILIAVVILFGIIGIEVLGRSENTGIIHEVREALHGNYQDTFGSARLHIWKNALKVFPNRPIIGSGPDTFINAFPEAEQGRYGQTYENAHNEYIQILICQGIAGLLCYLVFLISVFYKSVVKAFKNPILMAVLIAFVGYCVQAFFNLSLPITSQLLWVFAGFLANKRLQDSQIV